MRIRDLTISNFRGIRYLEASALGDTIIIAGQNGSGKSCIFDAIRLLKSTYGGYQQNEWQHFFGEFAIQLHGAARNLEGLFNNKEMSINIAANFEFRDDEKRYVIENARDLLEETIWQSVLPEAFQWGGYRKAMFAAQFRDRQDEVTARVDREISALESALSQSYATGAVNIDPSGSIRIQNSAALTVVFSNYRPRKIGVIDFHGAQRHYGREHVQGINLSLEQSNQNYSQHTLYNYNNKYNNVKSEMAGNFVKELLSEKAGEKVDKEGELPIVSTMKELFESFFPDKKFEGPKATADGSLSFPVMTQNGSKHDLDELSSGEKEILYGYLRIRSSAPKNSIILLDEPELHLNPRLIRGLPEFYKNHLGTALQNQLWLVTHSDALIREAVGRPGFNVFHMLPCGAESTGTSQLKALSVSGDLDVVLADLVGDLAAYRPGGKGLIFEGGGDLDFDKSFVGSVFSEELRGINLISGTNKQRVKVLHDVLHRAYERGDLPTKFYAITDKDAASSEDNPAINRYEWDVYHIENYLLDSNVILEVMMSIDVSVKLSLEDIDRSLSESARNVVPNMINHELRSRANSMIVQSIKLNFSPSTLTASRDLHAAATKTAKNISDLMEGELREEKIHDMEVALRREYEDSFSNGDWKAKLPGREILRQFVSKEGVPVGYEVFRNLIVSRMVDKGIKPHGMKRIIDAVRDD